MRYSIFFAAAVVVCWKERVGTWQWEERAVCVGVRRRWKEGGGGDRRDRTKKRPGGRRGRGMRREREERRMKKGVEEKMRKRG